MMIRAFFKLSFFICFISCAIIHETTINNLVEYIQVNEHIWYYITSDRFIYEYNGQKGSIQLIGDESDSTYSFEEEIMSIIPHPNFKSNKLFFAYIIDKSEDTDFGSLSISMYKSSANFSNNGMCLLKIPMDYWNLKLEFQRILN